MPRMHSFRELVSTAVKEISINLKSLSGKDFVFCLMKNVI